MSVNATKLVTSTGKLAAALKQDASQVFGKEVRIVAIRVHLQRLGQARNISRQSISDRAIVKVIIYVPNQQIAAIFSNLCHPTTSILTFPKC